MYIIRPFCEGPVKTSLFPATKSIPRRKDQSLTQGIHWCCEPVVPLKQHVVGYKSNIVHTYIDIYAYHNMVYNVIHSLIIYIYMLYHLCWCEAGFWAAASRASGRTIWGPANSANQPSAKARISEVIEVLARTWFILSCGLVLLLHDITCAEIIWHGNTN